METLEYISVSDAAKYYDKTTTTIYNMIKDGTLNSIKFKRGLMAGFLVAKPVDYDEWLINHNK